MAKFSLSEEQKESQRKKLLVKGKELMLQYGIKKTTVDDVVNACKIAKGTFYLYFNSKEDFFCRLITDINQHFFAMAERLIIESNEMEMKSKMKLFFENIFNTPELAFYFREHQSICELTEKMSDGSFTDKETMMIKNLLTLGKIDTVKIKAEIVHNYIHIIFLARTSNLMIEEYREQLVSSLINCLVDYIFSENGDNQIS